jgi:VanZ family protein
LIGGSSLLLVNWSTSQQPKNEETLASQSRNLGEDVQTAYLALSFLPVIGFRDRRRGPMAGLSMFLPGVLMEGGQHFSPGRAVELGDVVANGVGVSCGALLGLPIRTLIALI